MHNSDGGPLPVTATMQAQEAVALQGAGADGLSGVDEEFAGGRTSQPWIWEQGCNCELPAYVLLYPQQLVHTIQPTRP